MKINTKLIKYDDVCYIPLNDWISFYGYARVVGAYEDILCIETETEKCFIIPTDKVLEIGVDFVHKESWVRESKAYIIE